MFEKHKFKILILFTIFIAISFTYIITNGEMSLLKKELMGINFTNSLDNLLKGRFDLDSSIPDIGETYFRNDKAYTYFGLFPVVFRGIVELVFKRGETDWSRISIIFAAIFATISAILTYYKANKSENKQGTFFYFYLALFALNIAFGSAITVLLSSAIIYHESIMWALAWNFFYLLMFIYFLQSKEFSPKILFLLSLSSGILLQTRISIAIAPFITTVFLIFTIFRSTIRNSTNYSILNFSQNKFLISITVPLLICGLLTMKINYERWEKPFCFCDYKYYHWCKVFPERYEKFIASGGFFNFSKIPHTLTYYFIPLKDHFSSTFPHVNLIYFQNIFKFKEVYFDLSEPGNPVCIHNAFLFFMSILGLFSIVKTSSNSELVLFSAYLIQLMFLLSYTGLSLRYAADTTPLFMFLSIASYKTFLKLEQRSKQYKQICRSFVLLLTIVSIYFATSTMLQIKATSWMVDENIRIKVNELFEKANGLENKLIASLGNIKKHEWFNKF